MAIAVVPKPPFLGGSPLEMDWEAEIEELYWLLYPELRAAAQIGGTAALLKLASLGLPRMDVNWEQANLNASEWAAEYVGQLVRDITETTREQVRQAVSMYHQTPGMTRGELERLLLEGPGGLPDLTLPSGRIISAADRAEMTAITEVTRSYSEGELAAARASGMPMVEPRETPPRHVRCRCAIVPYPREDGTTTWRWETVNDDLVCLECLPLHLTDMGEDVPEGQQITALGALPVTER